MQLNERSLVELFHVSVARALFATLPDKTLVAIKGGINLRLFFGSPRYSEDMDLDVWKMAKATLEKRVDGLLSGPVISAPLKSRGVTLGAISKPKQTETVQRWKIEVLHAESALAARTKLEFSRRAALTAPELDPVVGAVVEPYELQPFLATHYRCREAVHQKVRALAQRPEPQPRDVFDLDVLFSRADAPRALDEDTTPCVEPAAARALDLTYDHYKETVVEYLDPEQADVYSPARAWTAMQHRVAERILSFA